MGARSAIAGGVGVVAGHPRGGGAQLSHGLQPEGHDRAATGAGEPAEVARTGRRGRALVDHDRRARVRRLGAGGAGRFAGGAGLVQVDHVGALVGGHLGFQAVEQLVVVVGMLH